MTKTESIMEAMKAALAGAGLDVLDPEAPDAEPAEGQVRDDIEAPYSFGDMPCIVLDCGDEHPNPVVGMGWVYWNLSVVVIIADIGAVPKMAPEPTRAQVHSALYADRTLGGAVIDLEVGPVSRGIDPTNPACGITQVTYNLKYRAMEGAA
jgi:hypothetical protein